jgi:hypothetical protein
MGAGITIGVISLLGVAPSDLSILEMEQELCLNESGFELQRRLIFPSLQPYYSTLSFSVISLVYPRMF